MRWRPTPQHVLERELAPYRLLSPTQRTELLRQACLSAARQLAHRGDRARVLSWSDPLPASSRSALARLRDLARL